MGARTRGGSTESIPSRSMQPLILFRERVLLAPPGRGIAVKIRAAAGEVPHGGRWVDGGASSGGHLDLQPEVRPRLFDALRRACLPPVPLLRPAPAPRSVRRDRQPDRRSRGDSPRRWTAHVLDLPPNRPRAEVPRPLRLPLLPADAVDSGARRPGGAPCISPAAHVLLLLGVDPRHPPGAVDFGDLPSQGGRQGLATRSALRRS